MKLAQIKKKRETEGQRGVEVSGGGGVVVCEWREKKDVLSNRGVLTWKAQQEADISTSLLRGQTVGLPQ